MPLYEYICKQCEAQFELLVLPNTRAVCPECNGEKLERLLSLPALKSSTTRELAMRSARKRDMAQGKEQAAAQREYELAHDD